MAATDQKQTATLSSRIRSLREKYCLTHTQLAALLGVDESLAQSWEAGVSPELPQLLQLAHHLHTSINYLLGFSDTPTSQRRAQPEPDPPELPVLPLPPPPARSDVDDQRDTFFAAAISTRLLRKLCQLSPEELAQVERYITSLLENRENEYIYL